MKKIVALFKLLFLMLSNVNKNEKSKFKKIYHILIFLNDFNC